LEKVSRGVYMVPQDIQERYERYRIESGEIEDEEDQVRNTQRKRASFRYNLDLSDALRRGESLDEVGVPDDISKEDASTSLYSWRSRRAASEGRNLDEVQVPKDIRKSEAVRATQRERHRRESLVEDRSRGMTTERIVKANVGWVSLNDRSTVFENDGAEMDAGAPYEAPVWPPDGPDEASPGLVNEPVSNGNGPAASTASEDEDTNGKKDPTQMFDFGDEDKLDTYKGEEGIRGELREVFGRVFGPGWDREQCSALYAHRNSGSFYQKDVFEASVGRSIRPRMEDSSWRLRHR
jgi:hypothetical protein